MSGIQGRIRCKVVDWYETFRHHSSGLARRKPRSRPEPAGRLLRKSGYSPHPHVQRRNFVVFPVRLFDDEFLGLILPLARGLAGGNPITRQSLPLTDSSSGQGLGWIERFCVPDHGRQHTLLPTVFWGTFCINKHNICLGGRRVLAASG